MKIVYCVNHYYPSIGGCENVSKKIVEFLKDKHDVTVITRRITGRNFLDFKNYKICEYSANDPKWFEDKIKSINPDLVFVYSDVFDFLRNILIVPNRKYKLILALCGANWLHNGNIHFLYKNLDSISHLICHSIFDRDYKICNNERTSKKLTVIPNAIDLNEFDTNSLDRESLLEQHKNKRWILNVSNFFPGKGQTHIIDILNKLKNKENLVYIQICNSVHFALGEQLENEWKKKVETKLDKSINSILFKNLTREKIIGFMKNSNLFLYPTEKEVAPLVILEAMAARLPWVATETGNIRSLKGGRFVPNIKNHKHESIIDKSTIDIFTSHVDNIGKFNTLSDEGRFQVEEEMTWDKVLPQYLKLIENA